MALDCFHHVVLFLFPKQRTKQAFSAGIPKFSNLEIGFHEGLQPAVSVPGKLSLATPSQDSFQTLQRLRAN